MFPHPLRVCRQVDVLLEAIGNLQLLSIFSCCNYEESWPCSFLFVEFVVSSLRTTVHPFNQATATEYPETQTLSCELMQTNERAERNNVKVEETSESSQPQIHHCFHSEKSCTGDSCQTIATICFVVFSTAKLRIYFHFGSSPPVNAYLL